MNHFGSVVLIFLLILIGHSDAYAYLDPGIGSYVLQLLLAFFLGAVVMFRRHMKIVSSLLKRIVNFKRKEN